MAIAAHRGNDCSLLHRPCRVHDRLSRRHHYVQEELICVGKEADDLAAILLRQRQADDLRRDLLQKDERGGDISLVELIAHRDRLREDGVYRKSIRHLADRSAKRGAEHVPHPLQPVHDLL